MRGRHLTEDEIIANIRAVDGAAVEAILPTVCGAEDFSAAVVGKCGGARERISRLLL